MTGFGGFEASRRVAERRGAAGTFSGEASETADSSALEAVLESYISVMEELVDSPDFERLVTPESLRQIFDSMPGGLGASAAMSQLLDSPQFQDPEVLRKTIREGIRTMKAYSKQLLEVFTNPERLAEVVDQLPAESQAALRAMLSGDLSQMRDIVSALPGLSGAQKQMLGSMLGGDTASMAEAASQVFEDSDQIEAARLEFLKEPSMAEMFGIPREVLNDKKKWAAMMAEGLESMKTFNQAPAAESEPASDLFAKAGARRRAA